MADINNPSDKDTIAEIVRNGRTSDFWNIICQVLDRNIAHQEAQMNDEDSMDWNPVDYKVTMEILKGRKRDLQRLKELPEVLLSDMSDPDQSVPDFDPYEKAED